MLLLPYYRAGFPNEGKNTILKAGNKKSAPQGAFLMKPC
jgi:hypothetical protein